MGNAVEDFGKFEGLCQNLTQSEESIERSDVPRLGKEHASSAVLNRKRPRNGAGRRPWRDRLQGNEQEEGDRGTRSCNRARPFIRAETASQAGQRRPDDYHSALGRLWLIRRRRHIRTMQS